GLQEQLGIELRLLGLDRARRLHGLLAPRELRRSLGREVEREGRARADLRLDVDLAAEQAGDLARDREAEPGAAEAAARRAVRLLEGLEDQLQLVLRDADPGVLDREPQHLAGSGESRHLEARPLLGAPDRQ